MAGCWIVTLILLAATWGLVVWRYPDLPDPFPTHWNARGEIDGRMPKPWGPFVLPAVVTLLQAHFAWTWSRVTGAAGAPRNTAMLAVTQIGLTGFFLWMTHWVLEAGLGRPVRMIRIAGLGLLVFVGLLVLTGLANA